MEFFYSSFIRDLVKFLLTHFILYFLPLFRSLLLNFITWKVQIKCHAIENWWIVALVISVNPNWLLRNAVMKLKTYRVGIKTFCYQMEQLHCLRLLASWRNSTGKSLIFKLTTDTINPWPFFIKKSNTLWLNLLNFEISFLPFAINWKKEPDYMGVWIAIWSTYVGVSKAWSTSLLHYVNGFQSKNCFLQVS